MSKWNYQVQFWILRNTIEKKHNHQIATWHIGIFTKSMKVSRLSKAQAKGQNSPNCSKIVLHFLKLSSILGNFMIILSNDFSEVPCDALCCIASTIFASSFEPWKLRLWVSCRPSTAPMLAVQIVTPIYFFSFNRRSPRSDTHGAAENLKMNSNQLSIITHAWQLFQVE